MTGRLSEGHDDHNEDVAGAGEPETIRFLERVAFYRQTIEHERFLGENPTVRPRRRDRFETAAAAIAAERLNGILQLHDELISPAEDVAEAEYESAMRSLTVWNFAAAGRAFDRASGISQLPRLQQRVTLGKGLLALVSDIVRLDPREPRSWRGADRALAGLIPTLDRLNPELAAHYGQEGERLYGGWREAGDDGALWSAWALVRARIAEQVGAQESALAWLLRAYEQLQAELGEASRLTTLVENARAVFRLILLPGEKMSEEERAALIETAENASSRELRVSLIAEAENRLGLDLARLRGRFVLSLYQSFDDAVGEP